MAEGTWVWAATRVTFSACTFDPSGWSCLCPTGYCGWEAAQPNAGAVDNAEDCTVVNQTWDGVVGDWPCMNSYAFICEM
jgi:hypothetical protein